MCGSAAVGFIELGQAFGRQRAIVGLGCNFRRLDGATEATAFF
jgi:hypothetical protein